MPEHFKTVKSFLGIKREAYEELDDDPVVAPLKTNHQQGEEYVRFVGTTWADLPDQTQHTEAKGAVHRRKVVKVEGMTSQEIHYLPKESLVTALGSHAEASKFVNSRKDHILFCKWKAGTAVDAQGRYRETSWAEVAVDLDTDRTLLRVS